MKNPSVIKHSATVQITNRINLFERKTWNALLAHAYYDLPNSETFQISEQELKKILGITTRDQKLLKNALEALVTCAVEFNYLGKDKKHAWEISALLSRANIEAGICTYEYNSFLRQILYKPEIYARISLSLQNKFNSKHTLALYELCVDYFISHNKYGVTPFISVDEFRALMGLDDNQYSKFTDLKRYIITPAIFEINKESDLYVTVEYKRESRKIKYIQFRIKPNPSYQGRSDKPSLLEQIEPALSEQIQPVLVEDLKTQAHAFIKSVSVHGISAKIAKKTIQTCGIEGAQESLAYAEAQIKKGNVKDVTAYVATCLSNGYGVKTQAERTAQQEREARIAKLRREADRLEKAAEAETQKLKDTVSRQNALLATLTSDQDAELSRLAEQKIFKSTDFERKRYRVQKKAGKTTMIDNYKRGMVEEFLQR